MVAAAPAVAYLMTYLHELGFCKMFGIPYEFISPNLTTVFIVTGALVLCMSVPLWLAHAYLTSLSGEHPIKRRIRILLPVLLITLALLYLFGEYAHVWLLFGSQWVLFLHIEFLTPLMTQRGKGSYVDKLRAEDLRDDRIDRPIAVLLGPVNPRAYYLFIFLSMALGISYFSGQSSANRKEEFLVPVATPDRVVLRTYADKLITSRLKRETRTVERSFEMISTERLTLRVEKVGPLRLAAP
jgi:hypothetical protein